MALHTQDEKLTSSPDAMPIRPSSAPLGPSVDGNTNSLVPYVIGYQEGGFGNLNYGIKVAKTGKDARTAAASDLVMSSAFNIFKIIATGTYTVFKDVNQIFGTGQIFYTGTTANAFATFVANPDGTYSSMPYVVTNTSSGATILTLVTISQPVGDGTVTLATTATAPSTQSNYAGSYTWTIRYYIFQETAS